jgi:hypothetical protein
MYKIKLTFLLLSYTSATLAQGNFGSQPLIDAPSTDNQNHEFKVETNIPPHTKWINGRLMSLPQDVELLLQSLDPEITEVTIEGRDENGLTIDFRRQDRENIDLQSLTTLKQSLTAYVGISQQSHPSAYIDGLDRSGQIVGIRYTHRYGNYGINISYSRLRDQVTPSDSSFVDITVNQFRFGVQWRQPLTYLVHDIPVHLVSSLSLQQASSSLLGWKTATSSGTSEDDETLLTSGPDERGLSAGLGIELALVDNIWLEFHEMLSMPRLLSGNSEQIDHFQGDHTIGIKVSF